jgi:hypothetical protein
MARRGDEDPTPEGDLTPEQEAALETVFRAGFHADPAEAARRCDEAARRLPPLIPRSAVARVEARVLADLWARMLELPDQVRASIPGLTPQAVAEIRRLVLEALPGGDASDQPDPKKGA